MGTVNIFCCYAREDEKFKQELEKHLSGLKRSRGIKSWYDRCFQPGVDWKQTFDEHLEYTDIVLVLLSSYFLEPGYQDSIEIKRALELHHTKSTRVVPILLRPTNWQTTPFYQLPMLPPNDRPVTAWQDPDEAFLNIAEGIRKIAAEMGASSTSARGETLVEPTEAFQTRGDANLSMPEMSISGKKQFEDIAKLLETRKKNNNHTVLLLGARTGGLFRSENLYKSLQMFSNRDFNKLSPREQFSECYTILTEGPFSEKDIHSILRTSLQNLTTIEADACLAALIKNEYFDEIITTNIDGVQEEALKLVNMQEDQQFEVSIVGRNAPIYEKYLMCRITKVFGDFAARFYSIRERSYYFEKNQELKGFLQRILSRDILVVGIDPVWDQDILRLIPGNASGTMWFVNDEEKIIELPLIADIFRERRTKAIVGKKWNYDTFIPALHEKLYGVAVPISYQPTQDRLHQLTNIANRLTSLSTQLASMSGQLASVSSQMQQLKSESSRLANVSSQMQQLKSESSQLATVSSQLQEVRSEYEILLSQIKELQNEHGPILQ